MIPIDSSNDAAMNRMSIRIVDFADSARSILSLYGHRSYYHKILDPREGPFAMALEMQADYSRVSRIIEDHLEDDLLPVEAASNAVDEEFGCESPKILRSSLPFPCRAIAVDSYQKWTKESYCVPFEKNEVLQVAAFSGNMWRVRKPTGEQGLAPSRLLVPYYPYRARVRFRVIEGSNILEKNQFLNVSYICTLYETLDPYSDWRPWRKETGETGIAPDACFDLSDKPLPPLPPLPGDGTLEVVESMSWLTV